MITFDEWEEFRERSPALARRFARLHPNRVPSPPTRAYDARPARALKRWTEDDDRILRRFWGEWTLNRFALELDRSPSGIGARAETLDLGSPAAAIGAVTLRAFERFSGFSKAKILNAAAALGIRLTRAKTARPRRRAGKSHTKQRTRSYAITRGQSDRLLVFLLEAPSFIGRSRLWGEGKKPSACVGCKTTERPHKARGMCAACYQRDLKKNA